MALSHLLENKWSLRKVGTKTFQEHINRYIFCAGLVSKQDVLNVACGIGFGAAYLAIKGAASVIGANISKEAISYTRNLYKEDNLVFVRIDRRKLPFQPGSFDVVVSFETIEHIPDADLKPLLVKKRQTTFR